MTSNNDEHYITYNSIISIGILSEEYWGEARYRAPSSVFPFYCQPCSLHTSKYCKRTWPESQVRTNYYSLQPAGILLHESSAHQLCLQCIQFSLNVRTGQCTLFCSDHTLFYLIPFSLCSRIELAASEHIQPCAEGRI